jgi:uncharacterized radical SAM superfamily Fe-S cluster-containing enzyme
MRRYATPNRVGDWHPRVETRGYHHSLAPRVSPKLGIKIGGLLMKSTLLPIIGTGQLLKRTTSRCPVCHVACPAEVWRIDGRPAKVFLKRTCPAHGEATVCIASDARFYWLAKGNLENASGGCAGSACCASDGSPVGTLGRNVSGRGTAPFEKLSTCLALIEIVNSCNLSCPTCYADSPLGSGHNVDAVPLTDLQRRIQGVVERKGGIEILQLSGGEPTLHPQFFELVEWIQDNPRIDYILLNTNGVRVAYDEEFLSGLARATSRGKFQLYLQFDGVQLDGQHSLRGADLRATRRRAIERCHEIQLPITLAMTVTQENLPFLWRAIEFGLQFPHVRGISFQPRFQSGRIPPNAATPQSKTPSPPSDGGEGRGEEGPWIPLSSVLSPLLRRGARKKKSARQEIVATCDNSQGYLCKGGRTERPPHAERLNTADIILAAVEQSGGQLRFEDFTPLPCGDPNCATIGYLLKANGRIHSISDFVDFTQVQDFLHDKVRYRLEDLMKCGCESEPLGALLRKFEMKESNTFRLFIKPFMDAGTWDQDRIDRCCTHVIRPDGRLDSFCRYYSGFPDARSAP